VLLLLLQDRHGLANGDSQLDGSQDYDLIGAQENETHTILRFRRKLVTCDDKDLNITVRAFCNPSLTFTFFN
jgi:hypothetical protein